MSNIELPDLYFGCENRESGHYLWMPGMHSVPYHVQRDQLPGPLQPHGLDGTYAPLGPEVEGQALLHHVHGRTVLAFWDRSVDHRGGSNSAFILSGRLTFEEAVAQARAAFPEVWARFPFEVVPAPPAGDRAC